MKLNIETVLKRANEKYREKKQQKGFDLAYIPPELQPEIHSDQVLALAETIVELINEADEGAA